MDVNKIPRREFLRSMTRYALLAGGAGLVLSSPEWMRLLFTGRTDRLIAADKLNEILRTAPVARYWVSTATAGVKCVQCHDVSEVAGLEHHEHSKAVVRCLLCAQGCFIEPGKRGKCRTRMNVDGELRTLVYGRPISVHVDPIEKKPFYHYRPGSAAFSLATSGCPLRCQFCQNWQISQAKPEDYAVSFTPPEDIVNAALNRKAPVIAFTYNEPTVFTEYLTDIARDGSQHGIHGVLISCGFMQEEPLEEMCEVLDAIKIDLKGFSEDFYRRVCGASLKPVLRSIKQVAKSGVHLEIVNLVVPTLNDSEIMLEKLSEWIAGEIGPDVPVHFTRFHPDYRLLNLPPTPVATLERARDIALKHGIHFPFVGNVPGHPGNNTYCPSCGKVVVERTGFFVSEIHIGNDKCEYCGTRIAGIWT